MWIFSIWHRWCNSLCNYSVQTEFALYDKTTLTQSVKDGFWKMISFASFSDLNKTHLFNFVEFLSNLHLWCPDKIIHDDISAENIKNKHTSRIFKHCDKYVWNNAHRWHFPDHVRWFLTVHSTHLASVTNVKKQARKPRSYASLKLWLTYLLTGVRFRATSVAKNCPPLLPTQCVEWPFRCSDSPFFWSHKNGYTFLKIQRFNSAEDLMMSRQCCRFNWGLPPPYATLQLFSSKYLWTLQYDRLELLKSKRL